MENEMTIKILDEAIMALKKILKQNNRDVDSCHIEVYSAEDLSDCTITTHQYLPNGEWEHRKYEVLELLKEMK